MNNFKKIYFGYYTAGPFQRGNIINLLYTYNANLFELFEVAGRAVHLRQKVTK